MELPLKTGDDRTRLALCRECDWLMHLPARAAGERAHCPRCHHHVTDSAQRDFQGTMAWALATLMMLALVFAFPFLGFSTHGIGHVMRFADTVHALFGYDYPSLALLLLATTAALPGIYLIGLVYLGAAAQWQRRLPGAIRLARTLRLLEPWMMSDVFVVGVLVSLIKIVSLADIQIHLSFVAYCLYAVMLIWTLNRIDWARIWDAITPPPALDTRRFHRGASGHSQRLMACHACDTPFLLNRAHRCPRCGKRHLAHGLDRLQLTWALLITSTILYIPANVYPVLSTIQLGNPQPQTIAGGVVHLVEAGDWPIALVIFVASIVVPISKIVALGWLCIAARKPKEGASLGRTKLYRVTETVGRWSMIDVFVVAVLGTLVQAGSLMSIEPESGALAFAAVVILTMIAALTFDTRLLWPDFPDDSRGLHERD